MLCSVAAADRIMTSGRVSSESRQHGIVCYGKLVFNRFLDLKAPIYKGTVPTGISRVGVEWV